MKKITHPKYKNYPEQPYISPDRNLKEWEDFPEKFPYSTVEKKQMIRLPEGLFPGDVVMLWRIHFGNFTNKTVIPQYFEYRYGIDSTESIKALIKLGYVEECNASETLNLLTAPVLKRILKEFNLAQSGKKDELLNRVLENIPEEELSKQFAQRKYKATPSGNAVLGKYEDIIQEHGPHKI